MVLFQELRYKRQSEFKEAQLQHFIERVKMQDEQLSKLDEELLLWHKNFDVNLPPKNTPPVEEVKKVVEEAPAPEVKILKSCEVQTVEFVPHEKIRESEEAVQIANLKLELFKVREVVVEKERNINQMQSKINELEMTINLFRKQIGDKQSQIAFYERHIMEFENKKDEVHSSGAGGDNINVGMESNKNNDEILALKVS